MSIRDHPGLHALDRQHVPDALSVRRGGCGRLQRSRSRFRRPSNSWRPVRALPPIAGLLAGPPLRRRKCGKLVARRAHSASPRICWENCGGRRHPTCARRQSPGCSASTLRPEAAGVVPSWPYCCRGRPPEGLRKLGPRDGGCDRCNRQNRTRRAGSRSDGLLMAPLPPRARLRKRAASPWRSALRPCPPRSAWPLIVSHRPARLLGN